MTKLLRVDASSRLNGSHSRELADIFQQKWFASHPDDEIVVRDLIRTPLPFIADATIKGFYAAPEQFTADLKAAVALSDELISELKTADLLVISTPMYNFSVPSALKAWIDQVVRVGHTFSYSPESGFAGLLPGKRAVIFTASGAAYASEAMQAMDFLRPYLRTLLGFLGFARIEVVSVEGTTIDEAAFKSSRAAALEQIERLAAA